MKRSLGLFCLLSVLFAPLAFAFQPPCGGSYALTVAPIIVPSAAATTVISAPSVNHSTYICEMFLQNAGGAATLSYGTGTNCATGGVNLSGALAATSLVDQRSRAGELMKVPPGNNFCVTGAASGAGTGYVGYVQVKNLLP